MTTKKAVHSALSMYLANEGDYIYMMELVVKNSLAYQILNERKESGRGLSEKQNWVVTFSIFEAGNEDKIEAWRKASSDERRQERTVAYNLSRYGRSFTCC